MDKKTNRNGFYMTNLIHNGNGFYYSSKICFIINVVDRNGNGSIINSWFYMISRAIANSILYDSISYITNIDNSSIPMELYENNLPIIKLY